MQRRTFLTGLAAGAASLPFWSRVTQAQTSALDRLSKDIAAKPQALAKWRRVRSEFLLNPDLVHLNCGSLGATPRLVLDAVSSYMYELEGNPVSNMWGPMNQALEAVRQRGADFIGADPDELVLTRNTTEGMNQVATGLDLKPGDEILTTNHEHGGGMVCWQHLAKRYGVKVKYLHLPVPVKSAEQLLQLIDDQITKRTRVCSFMHVDTITGMVMPFARIAELTRPRGILLAADGAQGPGMLAVDVHALGVDTYASSSHKWMLAPKGSGLLYIRREIKDRIQTAFLYSGYKGYSASAGTRAVPQLLGHGVAMDFHRAIGRQQVQDRCLGLSALVRERLKSIKRLRLLSPPIGPLSSGLVTYAVDGAKNSEIQQRMYQEHNILLKVVQGTYAYVPDPDVPKDNYNALRFSTHIYNSEEQVERTAALLTKILA